MMHRGAGRLLFAAFRANIRRTSSLSLARGDVSDMTSLSAKQLGKIALDVSRSGSSDIRVWRTFVECCSRSVSSFDGKDTLRLWKGVNAFYRNYDFCLRREDFNLLTYLILHSYEVCNGYTCDELSQLAEFVCDFAAINDAILDSSTLLFSKIGVMFNLRLAEALPYGVVRLLVSFSRLGIKDDALLESLAKFICRNEGFTPHDLRNILTSYALSGYCSPSLLKYATDQFLSLPGLSLNELAILSFAYVSLGYNSPDVRELFQRHLCRGAITTNLGALDDDRPPVDLPLFCANLDQLGVAIPDELMERIDINTLSADQFFKVVHLLPADAASQQQVLERYLAHESVPTVQSHLRVLEYTTKGDFCVLSLLHRAGDECKDGKCMVLGEHRYAELDTSPDYEHKPHGNSSGHYHITLPNESLKVTARENDCSGLDSKGDASNPMDSLDTFCHLLLRVPPLLLPSNLNLLGLTAKGRLSVPALRDLALLMSKALVDGNWNVESQLEELALANGTSLLSLIESHIAESDVCRSPALLSADLERCLGSDVDVRCRVGVLTVAAVLRTAKVAVIPLYPEDFVCLGEESTSASEPWAPPGSGARADVYATIYYLRRHSFKVSASSEERRPPRPIPPASTSTSVRTPSSKFDTMSKNTPRTTTAADSTWLQPLLDYDRLYKKMMQGTPRAGGHATVEKDVLYNKKAAYSDPVSRRQLLFELLKDAEADLAFYRADYSEMQLVPSLIAGELMACFGLAPHYAAHVSSHGCGAHSKMCSPVASCRTPSPPKVTRRGRRSQEAIERRRRRRSNVIMVGSKKSVFVYCNEALRSFGMLGPSGDPCSEVTFSALGSAIERAVQAVFQLEAHQYVYRLWLVSGVRAQCGPHPLFCPLFAGRFATHRLTFPLQDMASNEGIGAVIPQLEVLEPSHPSNVIQYHITLWLVVTVGGVALGFLYYMFTSFGYDDPVIYTQVNFTSQHAMCVVSLPLRMLHGLPLADRRATAFRHGAA
ncbi:uncharacterized protein BcabD6B2_35420 [Babesia caballi]|uniref:Membrane protein, putative n=1 Tax=Babesia caballi TaxID=5871 RepID=A0AAV4LWT3_BABCB|nr:membrane protein, putative [Babesia caballi]